MNIDIKLHKNDLPDDLELGNLIAVDSEFMGLDVRRDPLCLVQISSGKLDAHIVQLNRETYGAPNLIKVLKNDNLTKIIDEEKCMLTGSKEYSFEFTELPIEYIFGCICETERVT